MENAKLGRAILDHVTGNPANFDMNTWGDLTECGTVACLAGHTLILSGEYELVPYTTLAGEFIHVFRRVRDRQIVQPIQVSDLAQDLLGIDGDAIWHEVPGNDDGLHLFDQQPAADAIAWFRRLVEQAEARTGQGHLDPRPDERTAPA